MSRIAIPDELVTIFRETPELSRAYLVGGCVRDALLGIPHTDFDTEVYGASYERLAGALERWGRTDLVGRSFGVIKLKTGSGLEYDFSIPRRDSKIGIGHRGFEISFDADITPREAASRRDFTINALMLDPRTGEVLDFFGGQADLEARILRHVSDAFSEDPLRVLRGMQFAARFDLEAAPETIEFCRGISPSYRELAVERVREEWFKWAAKSVRPSAGLRFLVQTGWVEHYPEILALIGTPQEPEWHPEGDVFTHTCHCCDALVDLPGWIGADTETRVVLMLAVLAHDFAKPATTREEEKWGRRRIVSPGHEKAGGEFARAFLRRIDAPAAVTARVVPLVNDHLVHLHGITDRSVRRLARRLDPETIEHLCTVILADQHGRPPMPRETPEGVTALLATARELRLQDAAPRPVLLGRHLIALGLEPGAGFGPILAAAFDAQLDGEFEDLGGGFRWLAEKSGLEIDPDALSRVRGEFEARE